MSGLTLLCKNDIFAKTQHRHSSGVLNSSKLISEQKSGNSYFQSGIQLDVDPQTPWHVTDPVRNNHGGMANDGWKYEHIFTL